MTDILIHHYAAGFEVARKLAADLNEYGHNATVDSGALSEGGRNCRIVLLSPNGSADGLPG